jgi:uncharacterized protein YraI
MRRLTICLLAVLVLLTLSAGLVQAAPRADEVPAKVLSDSLNVRAGPGTNYGIVGSVQKGDMLRVLGRNAANDWLNVRTPGNITGWVSAPLVDLYGFLTQVPVVAAPAAPVNAAPAGPQAADAYRWWPFKTNTRARGTAQFYECFGSGQTPLREVPANTPIMALGTGPFQPSQAEAERLGAGPYAKIRIWDGQYGWMRVNNLDLDPNSLAQVSGVCQPYDRITWPTPVPPKPTSKPPTNPGGGNTYTPPKTYCCKICTTGQACGNSCISRSYTCHQPPGCACNG